jgi:hypothetical protein
MNPPARLPAATGDLDEWSVYVDWLLQEDDPRSEFLAFELSLPADPDRESLAAFQSMAKRWCRSRPATPTTWCLGHARTMAIPGERPMMYAYPRTRTQPSTGAYSNATEFLKTGAGARVERLELPVPYDRVSQARPWQRLMSALPASCAELALDIRGGVTDARELIDSLPAQVRTLVVGGDRVSISDAMALVDDRLDVIDVVDVVATADPGPLHAALGRTTRVAIRIDVMTTDTVHPRFELAAPADAALVVAARGYAIALRPTALLIHQKRRGVIPVRAQVEMLPDRYSLARFADRIAAHNDISSDLQRRGGRWTLRGATEKRFVCNGKSLAPGEIVELADRDTIVVDESPPATFVTSTVAARAMLGG